MKVRNFFRIFLPLILGGIVGFIINGSTGSYLMEFDNSDLIRERLEYKILKNKICR